MPSDRLNILIHGGRTRRMITVEIGRHNKRGQNFDSKESALRYIQTWLGVDATAAPSPVVAAKCTICSHEQTPLFTGTCKYIVANDGRTVDGISCGCECKFAPVVAAEVEQAYERGFRDGRISGLASQVIGLHEEDAVKAEMQRLRATTDNQVSVPADSEVGDNILHDLQAWLEFRLEHAVKYQVVETKGPVGDGYSYVDIPEWEARQKLDAIREAIGAVPVAASFVPNPNHCEHGVLWNMECLSCGPSDFVATPTLERALDPVVDERNSREPE